MNRSPSTFRVRARNTAQDSENKIHDDRVAAAHGFRGGLVPGVAVYGYMVPAILEHWGDEWMARGGISVRFIAPCYEGETVIARCHDSKVTAEAEDGSVYASGVVSLAAAVDGAAARGYEEWSRKMYPVLPLPPRDQRPVASSKTIVPGKILGTLRRKLEAETPADIPRVLLHLANEILGQNYMMSPWIHAGSEVHHHRIPEIDQEITVTGMIQECFERKGRRFAVAVLSYAQDGSSLQEFVASVRHTFIYDLGDSRNVRV